MSFPRPLTDTEKTVLIAALRLAEVDEIAELQAQADVAVATKPCPCGCPSVSLAVDANRAKPISHAGRLDVEVYYETGAVMVWADDGWLSNLEVWWWSDEAPTEFPPADALRREPPD